MEKIDIVINGKKLEVEKRKTILEIAKETGIFIPTLCHHPSIEPYGACRLCTVEIDRNGRKRFVTSCNYPVEDEIEIRTDSEDVLKIRRMILQFLIAKVGYTGKVKEFAEMYKVEPVFGIGNDDCILCGLCVNVCKEVIGVNAIGFSSRGINRKVSSPFEKEPFDCIGCGACSFVCPTGAIKIIDKGNFREITKINAKLELEKCKICGKPFIPKKLIQYMKNKIGLKEEIDTLYICDDCKKNVYLDRINLLTLIGGKK